MQKLCFKCGEEKPLSDFYKHPKMGDGYLGKCKACTKRDVVQNRVENLDHYVAYDKGRANLPHRVAARKEYAKSHPEVIRRCRLNSKNRYPMRYAARVITGNAIRDKRITKEPCEFCGNTVVEAHHVDYCQPLNVRWLCQKHHRDVHSGRIELPHRAETLNAECMEK